MTDILDLVIPSTFSCRTDIPSGMTPAGACPEEGTCSGEGVKPDCDCREVIVCLQYHEGLRGSSSSSSL